MADAIATVCGLVLLTLTGLTLMLVTAALDIPRYEIRNAWDKRRLTRRVAAAKTDADREDAEADLREWHPRTRNHAWDI
jgi:hypothetical protein